MTERDRAVETGFQIGSTAAFAAASYAAPLATHSTSEGRTAAGIVFERTDLTLGFAALTGFAGYLAYGKRQILREEYPAPDS